MRPPPVAEEGSKKAEERAKFCEAGSEQRISGTALGRRFKSGPRNHEETLEIFGFRGFFCFRRTLRNRRKYSVLIGSGPFYLGGKLGGTGKTDTKTAVDVGAA